MIDLDPAEAHFASVPHLIRKYNCRDIAEIGVERGGLTHAILSACQLDSHFLIDPWRPYSGSGAGWYFNQPRFQKWAVWDDLYDYVVKCFGDRTTILRLPSLEAIQQFQSNSLDLVFIDGDHSYEAVTADIQAWLPILRDTGILAGHDYDAKEFPTVRQAVHDAFPDDIIRILPGFVWFIEKRWLREI